MNIVAILPRIMLALLLIASVSACGKVQARTTPTVVALNTPPPPERITIPVHLPEPKPEPPPEPPPAAPAPPARTRPDPSNRGVPASPAAPAPATTAESPTSPVLQTTLDVAALEQRTNGLLKEAQDNLDRVNYTALSVQAQAQYKIAESFIKDAKKALDVKRYMYAEYLAAKAAAVAKELAKG